MKFFRFRTKARLRTVRAQVFTLLGLLALLSACGRPPDVVGIENPEVPVASQSDLTRHKIFMTTTREATDVAGVFYSGERGPEIGWASVDVTIPPTHEVGRLERPKRLPPDPQTEFTIVDPVVYNSDASFAASINRELAKRPPSERRILYFVHGYNTTTTDALLTLGQFVEDSDYTGVPVLLSWASAGRTTAYVYDLNSAFVARGKLAEIGQILRRTNATSIDVFAHSMGTLLTMEGMVNATQTGRAEKFRKIDHIVLASPDIDLDLFRTQIEVLPQAITEKITILTSEDDSALRASRRIAGGIPRVGLADAEELEEFGVVVIDLSDIDDSSSGSHSKFTGSPEVVQIIGLGLNTADDFGGSAAPPFEKLMANSRIQVFN